MPELITEDTDRWQEKSALHQWFVGSHVLVRFFQGREPETVPAQQYMYQAVGFL